ncbi:MAG: tyrosine-type recombinase/integrase [Bacillota bacterium]
MPYKRGRIWYIDIYINGQRFRRAISKSLKKAEEVEEELKWKIKRKQLRLENIKNPVHFDFIARKYLFYCKSIKSKRTYQLEDTDYKKHIEPIFGEYILDDINNESLLKYQAVKKEQGYSNRTVNIHIGLIRKIVNYAKDHGYGSELSLKYPMLPESEKVHAFLTPDEVKRFLKAFSDNLTYKRILFGFATGMRPAELAYLSWPDIDFEMKMAKVTSKPPFWIIKTKQERVIPLNKIALKILKELYQYAKSKWVFSNNDRPVLNVRRAIDSARIKAGIEKKITPNMIRHTFATIALMKGADLKSVQELLGHRDIKTTMRYTHAVKEQLRKTVDMIKL